MTTAGYLYFAGLLLLAAAWNFPLVYVINWRRVAMAFCALTVAVAAGLIVGTM